MAQKCMLKAPNLRVHQVSRYDSLFRRGIEEIFLI